MGTMWAIYTALNHLTCQLELVGGGGADDELPKKCVMRLEGLIVDFVMSCFFLGGIVKDVGCKVLSLTKVLSVLSSNDSEF